MIDLNLIKPDGTGKYSPLLYKWLTHKSRKPWHFQHVFQTKQETVNGRTDWAAHWRSGELIIGAGQFDEKGNPVWIGGRRVRDIICGLRGALTQGFAYSSAFGLRDITDQFWPEYVRVGRCAWDHSHSLHMIGDEGRFAVTDNGKFRVCNWCGRRFEAVVKLKPVIEFEERTTWNEYRSTAPATLLHPMGSCGEEI